MIMIIMFEIRCLACHIVMHCVVVEYTHTFLMIMYGRFFVLIFKDQNFQFSMVMVPSKQNLGFATLHRFRISSDPSWDGYGYLLEPHINY